MKIINHHKEIALRMLAEISEPKNRVYVRKNRGFGRGDNEFPQYHACVLNTCVCVCEYFVRRIETKRQCIFAKCWIIASDERRELPKFDRFKPINIALCLTLHCLRRKYEMNQSCILYRAQISWLMLLKQFNWIYYVSNLPYAIWMSFRSEMR